MNFKTISGKSVITSKLCTFPELFFITIYFEELDIHVELKFMILIGTE